jgi:hypothetical protein
MKKGLIIGIVAVIAVILVILFISLSKKTCACPSPSEWSSCNGNAEKTRTNYKCNESLQCESFPETTACSTFLEAKSTKKEWTLLVSPTLEDKVSGIIKGSVSDAPDSVEHIAFLIFAQGAENPVAGGEDTTPSDGFSYMVDTAKLANGLYTFTAVIFEEGMTSGGPPKDGAAVQILVEN